MLAWIFSIVAVAVCDFMVVEPDNFSSDNEVTLGLFKGGVNGDCEDVEDPGSGQEAAQAFGVICSLFGAIVLVIMTLGLFFPLPVVVWRIVTVTLFVLAPFQLFTFSIFGDCEEGFECTLGAGGGCAITAFIYWIVAGIFTCRMPMSKKAVIPCCSDSGGGCCNNADGGCGCCDQSSTEAVGTPVSVAPGAPPAPGTRTITEEVVHPDGRRTITTTVIPVE